MDYTPVIKDLEGKCEKCEIGQARKILGNIQIAFGPAPDAGKSEPVTVTVRNDMSQSVSRRGTTNRNERSADGKSKICNGPCGAMKALDQYPANKGCSDGHAGTCSECTRARAKKWWAKTQTRKKVAAAAQGSAPDPGLLPGKLFKCGCGKQFTTRVVFEGHREKCPAAA